MAGFLTASSLAPVAPAASLASSSLLITGRGTVSLAQFVRVAASSRQPQLKEKLGSVCRLASSSVALRGCHRIVGVCKLPRRTVDFERGVMAKAATLEGKTFHDFTVENIDGKEVSLSEYKGKVALVVNVASACGLTQSNYTELTALYEKFKNKDFIVLAFPSNQFGAQEPGSNEQIKEFACSRYNATFPLFAKIDVNGANTAPVYKFLKSQKGGGILGDGIKWNFGKFLVDKEGTVVERYAPTTSPSAIEADIQKLL